MPGPPCFPSPLRKEGRETSLPNLAPALQTIDTQATTTDTQRLDLHDGRGVTCLALFRTHATLLGEDAGQPKRDAAFFDLGKAGRVKSTPKR